jgi:hypothetical protein
MAKEPRSYFSIKETNEPSLDTWLPSTNFLQVGFRPGYSLQARELIEIQSIIQHQISTFAQELGYVHGSLAKICESNPRLESPVASGDGDIGEYSAVISMSPGYFFMKDSDRLGHFVRYNHSRSDGASILHNLFWSVNPESPDNQTEVVFMGLEYEEQTITPEDDPGLYDNAAGFPNENAPGAVRYHVDVKPELVVKNVLVNVGAGSGEYSQQINNAVINDLDGNFSASNFVPLFYWSYPEQNVIRLLHTDKAEYELQFDEETGDVLTEGDTAIYFKVDNPSNISLESGDGKYEYCT